MMIVYLIGIFICFCGVYIYCKIDDPHVDMADIVIYCMIAIFCSMVWPVFLLVLVLNVLAERIKEKWDL